MNFRSSSKNAGRRQPAAGVPLVIILAALALLSLLSVLAQSAFTAEIKVSSPPSAPGLLSGEGVMLEVTVNESAALLYFLDGAENVSLPGNMSQSQSNYTAAMNGKLPGNVIANGAHNLLIYAYNSSAGIVAQASHNFSVQDNEFPYISLTPPLNNTAISSMQPSYQITATSNEYANISYSFNSAGLVKAADVARSANITMLPNTGGNSIVIAATDMQGNSQSYQYFFNFSLVGSGTCSDAIQNYHEGSNETGVDCGGPCAACIPFSISTDKDSYALGDLIYVSVQARPDAQHNITITGPGYATSFAYNGSTYYIIFPPNPGLYKINISLAYRNLSPDYIVKFFTVNSSSQSHGISAAITANATTINANEAIEFKSQITGNLTIPSYRWDLNSDNVTDSTGQNVNFTYNSPGTYTANLTAFDNASSASAAITITVRNFYNVTINVTSTLNAPIPLAYVTINSETKAAAPLAQFHLPRNDYTLYINASGFESRTPSISVSQNSTYSFVLVRTEVSPPVITLTGPDNGQVSIFSNATFRFVAKAETTVNCILLTARQGQGWISKAEVSVTGQSEQAITISGLENATHSWRVECSDEAGNTAVSETRSITVQLQGELSLGKEEELVAQLVGQINEVIAGMNAYDKPEKEAAEALNLLNDLEKSKTELERAIRDLRNVKWRNFNGTEEKSFIEEKTNEIYTIADNITTGITVKKMARFVSYPTKQDVKDTTLLYLNSTGKKLTQKEIEKYADENIKLQQSVVITTDYKVIELTMRGGRKRTLTLVQKSLEFKDGLQNLVLIETIPKDVAKSVSNIKFLVDYDTVSGGHAVIIKIPGSMKFSYYLEEELTPEQIQKTISALLTKPVAQRTGSGNGLGPTGFAVFSGNLPIGGQGARLAAEVVLVVVLLTIYLAYARGFPHRESKQLKQLKQLTQQITAELQKQGNYGQAKKLYAEAGSVYKQLNPHERQAVYSAISELRYELDAQCVKGMIDEALSLLSQGKQAEARRAYEKMSLLYKSLPAANKKTVHESCSELHQKLLGPVK